MMRTISYSVEVIVRFCFLYDRVFFGILNIRVKNKFSRFFEKSKATLVDVDDETDFVSSGNGAKGKAKIKMEVEKKKKKDTKCDIPTLKLRTSSRLLPHMRFLSTALKDAHVKYESFKTTFASIYDIFEKVTELGILHEDSVEIHKYADSDQLGLIKLLEPYLQYMSKIDKQIDR